MNFAFVLLIRILHSLRYWKWVVSIRFDSQITRFGGLYKEVASVQLTNSRRFQGVDVIDSNLI